ncbi:hypothetical protein B0I08_10694 [Glaciihabitans tibetensis]|uniref:Uncharacterized protein n=1 Tax=Glaciihabitans tibetensis TaxID=1266600 RepID=A0A2T0VBN0_9MICO|nr:hypothetical protein B0I08_10694 [Glaciihabitans tibetensis]
MSETPRIVFTLFAAHTDSMVAAWQRFSGDLLPDANGPLGKHPEALLTIDRSPVVHLPTVQRGYSGRGLRHPSLRGAAMPPRRVSGAVTSASLASSASAPSAPARPPHSLSSQPGDALASAIASASSASESPTFLRPPATGSSAPLGGVWRLLATNNREIARSVRVYPTFAEARADVDRVCANRERLVVAAVVGPDRGTRGWYATLDGEPVITCSRWYETSSSSVAASADAVEALQLAVIVEAVRTIESADRRRSRSRATESSVGGW